MQATKQPPQEKMLQVERPSIKFPTLEGDRWEVIPGLSLELTQDGKGSLMVIDGEIKTHNLNEDTVFRLRIVQSGVPAEDLQYLGVVTIEGEDNWKEMIPFGSIPTGDGGEAFEIMVPVIRERNALVTKPGSNSLKVISISKSGVYQEWTVAIVIESGVAYLLQQHNYCEQVYRAANGVAMLPRTRSTGNQPKRLAVVDLIRETLENFPIPAFEKGRNYLPAPTGEGLKAGQARMMWWSIRRRVGGAVTHTGEQVRVLPNNITRGYTGNFCIGQNEIVQYKSKAPTQGGTSFKHDLLDVELVS